MSPVQPCLLEGLKIERTLNQ